MMIHLTIDGKPVEAPQGMTVLDAAATVGVHVPTLCHLPGKDPLTSCMVCLVRVNGQAKLSPACATKVTEGMTIESETKEIKRARQTAIELLLSEHAGDCLAPCQLVCPAKMRIDRMLWHIGRGEFRCNVSSQRYMRFRKNSREKRPPAICAGEGDHTQEQYHQAMDS